MDQDELFKLIGETVFTHYMARLQILKDIEALKAENQSLSEQVVELQKAGE